jgi:hypothetical protein
LIARGTIQGRVTGLLYDPRRNTYDGSDRHQQYSQNELQNFIQNGDTLSFMGVYPGTGAP